MIKFEIFETEKDGLKKSKRIDILFGYRNVKTKTDRYRFLRKKCDEDIWAGVVCEKLVNTCINMTREHRAMYYDDADLKEHQFLKDNGWNHQYKIL